MINPPLHSWGFPLCGKRRKGWDAGGGGEAVNCCPRLSAVGSSLVKMGENGNALVLPVKIPCPVPGSAKRLLASWCRLVLSPQPHQLLGGFRAASKTLGSEGKWDQECK